MAKRIIWSLQAKDDRRHILNYWFEITKNKKYSSKLAFQFRDTVKYIAQHNYIGRATDVSTIRDTVCGDYLIFYKISENFIEIVSIFDTRRNPEHQNFLTEINFILLVSIGIIMKVVISQRFFL